MLLDRRVLRALQGQRVRRVPLVRRGQQVHRVIKAVRGQQVLKELQGPQVLLDHREIKAVQDQLALWGLPVHRVSLALPVLNIHGKELGRQQPRTLKATV